MSSTWLASLPGAVLGLVGVLYAQLIVRMNFKEQREWQWESLRRQQRQHEAQLAAAVELERAKHRREIATDALNDALTASGKVAAAFWDMETAVVRADEQQHTIPGNAPADTDRVVAARQRCRNALAECDAVVGRLLLLGYDTSYESLCAFGRSVAGHVEAPRPPLATEASDAVTARCSEVVRAVREDGRTVLGTAADSPGSGE